MTADDRGQHQFGGAGFLVGAFGALGLPFTSGYPGHWRIYVAAMEYGWLPFTLLVIATILSVLAYVRVIALGIGITTPSGPGSP